MMRAEEEVYLWEDLLHKVSNLLGEVDSSRGEAKDTWDEETPEFDRLEWLLSDAYGFIEGRLQELDTTYSERKAWGMKAKAQARKALSYGINYQALRGLPYEETDKALIYIEEHGLVSMNYEATQKALRQYRKSEESKMLQVN